MTVNLPPTIGPTDLYVVTIVYVPGIGYNTPPLMDGVLTHTCLVFDVDDEEASKRAISMSLIAPTSVVATSAISLAQMLEALHKLKYDQAEHDLL